MIFKKGVKKMVVDDRNLLRSLRLQVESVKSSYVLGLIGEAEYNILLSNISDQVEVMEVKYGILQAS